MTIVRIFQPVKTTMQSGLRKACGWVLAFEQTTPPLPSPPMGWISGKDMNRELSLEFPSLLKAIEYAKLHGLSYTIHSPSKIEIRPKNYGDNFTCPRIRG